MQVNKNNYNDDEIIEIYEDEDEEYKEEKKNIFHIKKVLRLFIIFLIIILTIALIDIIAVTKYNVGPFFAIPTHKYNDGGTKEYFGIGYKVISYHQTQGRRDKEIGSWNIKYINPTTIKDIDLAIELEEDEIKTYNKYYKKFLRIISTLKSIDKKNNTIIIGYEDEGKKYSVDIKCKMVKEKNDIENLEIGKQITIIGTLNEYRKKQNNQPKKLYIINCFAEQ